MLTCRTHRGGWNNGFAASPFDRVLEGMFVAPQAADHGGAPVMNVWEDEQSIIVETDLPGIADKDVEVSITGGDLTIAGTRTIKERENAVAHRVERPSGRFERTLRINRDIDSAKVTATFEAGVLTVTLPKSEASKPRKIDVKSN